MNLPLSVAVAQPVTVVGDVARNVESHSDAVRRAHSRLVVFPELSLTGYSMNAKPVDDHDVLEPLQVACAPTNTIALVGAPTTLPDGTSLAISILTVSGAGVEVIYHKMDLSDEERRWFTAGESPAKVSIDGWDIGVGVCKDTRGEAHLAATFGLGIDLYVAGVVHNDRDAHELAERAERIAHRASVPVAIANGAGAGAVDGFPPGAGCSAIWNRDGELLEQAGTEPGEIAIAILERYER